MRNSKSRGDTGFRDKSSRKDKIHPSRKFHENEYCLLFAKFVGMRVSVKPEHMSVGGVSLDRICGKCEDVFRDSRDQKRFRARVRLDNGAPFFCAVRDMEIVGDA